MKVRFILISIFIQTVSLLSLVSQKPLRHTFSIGGGGLLVGNSNQTLDANEIQPTFIFNYEFKLHRKIYLGGSLGVQNIYGLVAQNSDAILIKNVASTIRPSLLLGVMGKILVFKGLYTGLNVGVAISQTHEIVNARRLTNPAIHTIKTIGIHDVQNATPIQNVFLYEGKFNSVISALSYVQLDLGYKFNINQKLALNIGFNGTVYYRLSEDERLFSFEKLDHNGVEYVEQNEIFDGDFYNVSNQFILNPDYYNTGYSSVTNVMKKYTQVKANIPFIHFTTSAYATISYAF
jgi:hypothetical protein